MSAKRKRHPQFKRALKLIEAEIARLKAEWQQYGDASTMLAVTYFDQRVAANQILEFIRSIK